MPAAMLSVGPKKINRRRDSAHEVPGERRPPYWVLVSFLCPPGAHSLVGRQILKMQCGAA